MSNLRKAHMSILGRSVYIAETPPIFLAPTLACLFASTNHQSKFSTSTSLCARRRRDANPGRGVSALRRTGLRFPVGMSKVPLPEPVLNRKRREKVKVDKEHGLWGFFNKNRTSLSTPEENNSHGMSFESLCLEASSSLI